MLIKFRFKIIVKKVTKNAFLAIQNEKGINTGR